MFDYPAIILGEGLLAINLLEDEDEQISFVMQGEGCG